MPQNVNRVVMTGNLTRDPELKTTQAGMKICNMRVASSSRVKRGGEWTEKPNYFDVVVFGAQAENCERYLQKGRMIALDGRLDWREWEQDGAKRQAVQILAENVQFLDGGERSGGGGSSSGGSSGAPPVSAAPAEDDIPF